jgi:hypothetical protein
MSNSLSAIPQALPGPENMRRRHSSVAGFVSFPQPPRVNGHYYGTQRHEHGAQAGSKKDAERVKHPGSSAYRKDPERRSE